MPDIISCDVVYPHVIIKVFETFLKLKKHRFLKNSILFTCQQFKYFNFIFYFCYVQK